MDVTIFYISPWMMLGLILGTVYFVLLLLGHENRNENKTRKKSEDVLTTSTGIPKVVTEQKKVQTTEKKPGSVVQRKESDKHKSGSRKQIGETPSYQTTTTFDSRKSKDVAPVDKEEGEKSQVEKSLEALEIEDILQSRDAVYLQEFNVPEDFIADRQRIRAGSRGSVHSREDSSETMEKTDNLESSEEKEAELYENVSQTVCSSVSSAPTEQIFNDIVVPNSEQPIESSNNDMKSTDLKESGLFGDFADLMFTQAKEGAFYDIDLESKANIYAHRISSWIVSDAVGQFAHSSLSGPRPEDFHSSEIQELHTFAENVVDSLIQGASDNVSLFKDVEAFAKDVCEQVIFEGIEQYATTEKLEQGRKQKLSLSEMKIFSESIVSEVVSEGIEEAIREDKYGHADLVDQSAAVSSSLQPHIFGIVDNLVNNTIYEALLRAKGQGGSPSVEDSELEGRAQEVLESQVSETVQEVIVSALHQAVDLKEQKSKEPPQQDKNELESQMRTFVDGTLDAAVTEAAGKVQSEQGVFDLEGKVLNGHVDLSLESDVHQKYEGIPQISVKLAVDVEKKDETQDQGVDVVPSRENFNGKELNLRETKSNEQTDYWRRSLIMDLEDNEDFDESFESEKSKPSAEKESVSDEDASEEFIDSSEDEVIDHAEDVKLGAVGGSNAAKYEEGDSDADEISEDELDDDDDDLLFAGQTMVDGLCVSKPKEKRKRKKKSIPRARIQSAGSHYNQAVVLNNRSGTIRLAGSHYNQAVVLDNGSGILKLGMAGERMPNVIQPALYGIPKRYSLQMAGMDNKKDRTYGDGAAMRAGVMQLEYPMSGGFLDNWSDVEDVWEYMLYSELGIEEGNHPVLVTEVANRSRRDREKMAEVLFEHLSVPAMYLANQLVLSLYASGLTLGLCLSSGSSVTQAATIYEGYILSYTVQELDIGGKSLTDNLQKLLRENKGHTFNSSSGWQIVNNMKERMAYVAQDYSSEMKQFKTDNALTQFYSLPDGQTVDISSEMISTPEPLFNPETLLGADDTVASQFPIHKLVNDAFGRCAPDLREVIHRNVVLSGGTTLTKGLVPRLEHELSKINPKIRSVRAPDNRLYSAWIGGSILGSLSTMDSMYATIDEYADYGGRIVSQKCF